MLEFLELPRSTYYYVIKSINKSNLDEDLMKEITNIFNESHKRYGYRRVTLVLNKNRIKKVNHKKVKRIMKELGLFAIQGKNGKYHSYKGDNGEFKENLLLEKVVDEEKHKTTYQRHFETEKPNEKWVTDVSEFKHPDGKLYLSPVLDLHDHSIIAYDISTSPNFDQTKRMIDKAFESNPNLEGLIFHSDQGWQYQMKQYKQWLDEKGIRQSFSRKGNCMDNSVMENFFGIVKNEMFYGHEDEFETLDDLRKAIEEYIEWYNFKRISIKRNGMSPFEYRQHSILQLQY